MVRSHHAAHILDARDRCDGCNSRAYVIVVKGGSRLDFCGHHFNEHEPSLLGNGWHVLEDDRYLLTLGSTA